MNAGGSGGERRNAIWEQGRERGRGGNGNGKGGKSRRQTQDGNGDGGRDGTVSSSGDENGGGNEKGPVRPKEGQKSARDRTRVVDAIWETGEILVERENT